MHGKELCGRHQPTNFVWFEREGAAIAHITRGPIQRQQVVLPELRTKNLTQIKLNSWLLEADRKIKRIKLAPSRKKSVMYLWSATLAFKFMTGSVPDYLTSKFTKRFKISGRETRNSQSLHIPLFLKIDEWPEKRWLQNSEDIELIGQWMKTKQRCFKL